MVENRDDLQWERTLSPTVRKALEALQPVPEPDPESWEAGREAFLAEAREYSAQARRGSSEAQRHPREDFWSTILSLRWKRTPLLAMAKLILVVGLLLGTLVGTARAAQGSLPGSPLYPLKLQMERWEMAQIDAPEERVEEALERARTRVEEAERLSAAGGEIPGELARYYRQHLDEVIRVTETLTETSRSRAEQRVQEELARQQTAIARVLERREPLDNGPSPALEMLRAMEEARGGPPPDERDPREGDEPSDGEDRGQPPEEEPGPPAEKGPPEGAGRPDVPETPSDEAGPPDQAGDEGREGPGESPRPPGDEGEDPGPPVDLPPRGGGPGEGGGVGPPDGLP